MIKRLVLLTIAVGLLASFALGAPLVEIVISPEGRVKVAAGKAEPVLQHGGWTEFEITIENTAGLTTPLTVTSKQLMTSEQDTARHRWLKFEVVPAGPLSGQPNETRTLRVWSRDAGRRAAVFTINAGQGSQDLGFRSDVLVTFLIRPGGSESRLQSPRR